MSGAVFYVDYTDYTRKPVAGYALCPTMLASAVEAGASKVEIRHRTSGVVWSVPVKSLKHVDNKAIAPWAKMSKIDARDPRGWEK